GDLNTSVREYHNALRLGRYHEASRFLKPGDQQAFLGGYEELGDDFAIVEVNPKVVSLGKDGKTAWSETEIRWYRMPDMTIRKDNVKATWEYREGNDSWIIVERDIQADKKHKRRHRRSSTTAKTPKATTTTEPDSSKDAEGKPETLP
ncbi:MAG: hypothetical protein AAFX99_36760, partial [Myxococcota bacterium]